MSEDKALLLGREKTGKLLWQYALPAIAAMIASSLYNLVDRIFIGHVVGALAISGLALTLPFMNLAAAFGSLVGAGGASLTSILLGKKRYSDARLLLGNVVLLNLILGFGLTIICFPFINNILLLLGGSPQTIPYARSYMVIIIGANVITHLYFGLNSVLRASGQPGLACLVTIVAVLLNVVLDALFVYVFRWGIAGAAWATVISQAVSFIWLVLIFLKQNHIVHFERGIFHLKKKIVSGIVSIGLAPFFVNAAGCLVVILVNYGLKRYGGDLAIGAYGIVNGMGFIFVMLLFGLTQGMQPIVGYNYGARLYDRVLDVLGKCTIGGIVIMSTGFILMELFPTAAARIFTTDENLIAYAKIGFRYVFASFPIVGFQIVASNFFQSVGQAKKSIFVSLTRQVLFLVPMLLILPPFFGIKGVWVSFPISDITSSVLSFILLRREVLKLKKMEQPLYSE